MKKLIIANLIGLFILCTCINVEAQDKKEKDKNVKLKIEKIENEKKTVTDTTFTLKKGEDLNKILRKYGVNGKVNSDKPGSYDIQIETGDSLKHKTKNMVWVNDDNDSDMHHIKIKEGGKNKQIIIADDDNIEINGDDEFSENPGDSVKHIKKIIHINSEKGNGREDTVIIVEKSKYKGPKHKKIEKAYRFSSDSTFKGNNAHFFFSDDDDEFNKVFINEGNNDSINIVIIKKLKGDMDEPFNFDFDNDFNWTSDNNMTVFPHKLRHQMAKASIEDASDADLNLIKLSKSYKKLDLKDFVLVLNGFASKLNLSFKTGEKGDFMLKVIDEKGNAYLVMELKDFDGKFDKEMEIEKGNNILQITQNKKQYVRKLTIE
jgi:hypothetical protein